MTNKVLGKSIVITGKANGIGRAWAVEKFFKEGAKVIACDIDTENLETLSDQGIKTFLRRINLMSK